MIRFLNKSVFEQLSRTNRVQKLRFDCMPLCSVSGTLFFKPILSICSSTCLFHIIFGCSCLLPITSKCNAPLNISSLFLLKTYPCHCNSPTLAGKSKVFFKPSKLTSSWLFIFSINLILHIAFSVLLKIASHSFSDTMFCSQTALLILRNSDVFFRL